MDTTPLVELIAQLHTVSQQRKEISAVDKDLKQMEDDLESRIQAAMDPAQASIAVNLPDGKATITRKSKTVYATEAGSADTFFDWVRANACIEFLNRAVKQEAVVDYIVKHGQPPPGIGAVVKTSLGLTFKRNPPGVE
jgi:hypothetical protein